MVTTPDVTLDPIAVAAPHCSKSCYKQPFRFTVNNREPIFNTLEMRLLFKVWGVVEWKQRSLVTKYENHASFISPMTSPTDVGGDSNTCTPFADAVGGKPIPPELWPCLVARLVGTRTCREVWWFRQSVPDVLYNGDARCLCPRQGLDPPGPRCGYCTFMESVLDNFVVAPREFVCRAHASLHLFRGAPGTSSEIADDTWSPGESSGDGDSNATPAPEAAPGAVREALILFGVYLANHNRSSVMWVVVVTEAPTKSGPCEGFAQVH
jgi:hypothetical protein